MSGRFPLSGARFITLIPCLPALTYVQTNHRSNAPFTPRVLLCGPAGSGKSLQAALLAQKYSLLNGECLPCPAPGCPCSCPQALGRGCGGGWRAEKPVSLQHMPCEGPILECQATCLGQYLEIFSSHLLSS